MLTVFRQETERVDEMGKGSRAGTRTRDARSATAVYMSIYAHEAIGTEVWHVLIYIFLFFFLSWAFLFVVVLKSNEEKR